MCDYRQQQENDEKLINEEIIMSGLIATAGSSGDFELCPAGVYSAVCIWVIDLGMQLNPVYGNTSRKVKIAFELANCPMSDGRPFMISRNYTLSLNEKATLRADLSSWRGRDFTPEEQNGFDIKNLLGAPCQINVIHNQSQDGRTFANIGALLPLGNGIQKPQPVNPLLFYNTHEPNPDVFEKLPQGIRDKITGSQIPTASVQQSVQPSSNQNLPHALAYNQHQQAKQNGYQPQQQAQAQVDIDDEIPF